MAGLGLVSPGVKVREVDLTVVRIDSISDQTGAIVGPFERGPVLQPLLVENEQDLIDLFGKPSSNDRQYEYWYTASNYLCLLYTSPSPRDFLLSRMPSAA